MVTLSGTITVNGSTYAGVDVWVWNDDKGTYQGHTTTDTNGNYSMAVAIGHTLVAVQYYDGSTYFGDVKSIDVPWYGDYSYKREILNVSLTDGLIVPLIDEDPDGDGSLSTYYAKDGYMYYNNDGDVAFGIDANQKYGFSTFVDGVANQQTAGSAPSDLVFYYPFDNDNAWDPINGTNGTLNGGITTGATGQAKNGYIFDGSDDYILTTKDLGTFFDGTNPYTFNMWINVPSSAGVTVDRYDILIKFQKNYQIHILSYSEYNSSGTTQFKIWSGSNERYVNGTDIRGDGWTMLTVTYDPSAGMELFENTISQGTNVWTGSPGTINNSNWIGYGGQRDYFEGSLDDLRLYSKVLSAAEIQTIHDTTKPTTGNDPTFGSEQTL